LEKEPLVKAWLQVDLSARLQQNKIRHSSLFRL
jgi:hypothetical protein